MHLFTLTLLPVSRNTVGEVCQEFAWGKYVGIIDFLRAWRPPNRRIRRKADKIRVCSSFAGKLPNFNSA